MIGFRFPTYVWRWEAGLYQPFVSGGRWDCPFAGELDAKPEATAVLL